jgi:hypothetical protein
MRDRLTFCIKTIHRPHCCATLVRSIYEHCGKDRPLIYVLDDGRPDLRFSHTCPDEAAMVDRLIETEYDIGLSAGRNRLVEAAQTRMVIFSDDDHVVGPQTRLIDLVGKFESSRLDLLATLSKQHHRPQPDGTPRLLTSSAGVLHIPRGEYRRAKVAGVKVGVATDHVFSHIHVDPPAYKRHRPVFLKQALRKHNLRKVLWR